MRCDRAVPPKAIALSNNHTLIQQCPFFISIGSEFSLV
ncbi:hypothetical protein GM3709_3379 [Geminocystis sp. NIES-3709]|nr:hypothetical protein GM3709_3379 [Geminocystis sp. NIES-3709]